MRGDNVFIYQKIIIHYKNLHNNIRTFVEFLDHSIYAFFCPAPRIFPILPESPFPPCFSIFQHKVPITNFSNAAIADAAINLKGAVAAYVLILLMQQMQLMR